MKIEMTREKIKEMQKYVEAYDKYEPEDMFQWAVKLYAEINNVNQVAVKLNEMGFRIEGKLVAGKRKQIKLSSNDVTELLNRKEDEGLLHREVKKILKLNRKRKGIVV